MITKKDLQFINDINNAIKNDAYDEIEERYGVDAWDIVERLLEIIKEMKETNLQMKEYQRRYLGQSKYIQELKEKFKEAQ